MQAIPKNTIWQQLKESSNQEGGNGKPGSFYERVQQLASPVVQTPCLLPGAQYSKLANSTETYYMLKKPGGYYLKLSERDYFLCNLMDGSRNLTQLALAYQQAYKAFAFERILGLVSKLKRQGFLTEPPVDVYDNIRENLELNKLKKFTRFVQQSFLHFEIAASNLDKPMTRLYKIIGWLGFSKIGLLFSVFTIVFGLLAFLSLALSGQYFLLAHNQPIGLSIFWLIGGYGFSIFLHELSHGLAVKHFGGEVSRGGLLIMYGMPAFFMNTSDIWMYNRKARIITSWAGPHMNFLIGGLCSVILYLYNDAGLGQILYPLAFICYMGAIFNLNVLLELDGYYILMDWLDIPRLRGRAFQFIRQSLWQKLWKRAKFTKEESILGWFGTLALLYTALTIFYSLWSLQTQLSRWIKEALNEQDLLTRLTFGLGSLALLILLSLTVGPLLWRVLKWASQKTLKLALAAENNLAISLLAGLILWLGMQQSWTIAYQISLIFFLLASLALTLKIWLPGEWAVYAPLRPLSLSFNAILWAGIWPESWPISLGLMVLALILFTLQMATHIELENLGYFLRYGLIFLIFASSIAAIPGVIWQTQAHSEWWHKLEAGFVPATLMLCLVAALALLRQQWRTRFRLSSLLLTLIYPLASGFVLWQAFRLAHPDNWLIALPFSQYGPILLWWLLLTVSLLYQFSYLRSIRLPTRQLSQADLSDQERLQRSIYYLIETALQSIQTTFGRSGTRRFANKLNLTAVEAGWPVQIDVNFRINRLDDGQFRTLLATGQQLSQIVEPFWQVLKASYGRSYAVSLMQRIIDSLNWEERELAEEYIFNRVTLPGWSKTRRQSKEEQNLILLAKLPLFAESNLEDLRSLARACYEQQFEPGELIMLQGAEADCFYVVKTGVVTVWQHSGEEPEIHVNTHRSGGYFGEVALLRNTTRNATCRANTNVTLLCLTKTDFERLVRRHFELAERLARRQSRLALLQKVSLFAETPLLALKELADQLQLLKVAAGQIVIQQGDQGDLFYIIEQGSVEILLEEAGSLPRLLDRRGPGEFLGEIALLMDTPRTATVRTLVETNFFTLQRDQFLSLIVSNETIKRDLERVATRRAISLGR